MRNTAQCDIIIGKKIEENRIMRGLSLEDLADQLEMSHQLLYRYEKGANRISATRLCFIADALRVSIEELLPEAKMR
ncbi:MAG: helix-turn-helix transcriptional regulator [Pseudomonadota bacterium]